MKSSSVEKAFADPQSLAVTAKVAAGLKDQLQKTPLQVEQRQQQLKRVLVDSDLFANNSTRTTAPLSSISGSISASASSDNLNPSGPKNLMPLSIAGLWLAEIITPNSARIEWVR